MERWWVSDPGWSVVRDENGVEQSRVRLVAVEGERTCEVRPERPQTIYVGETVEMRPTYTISED